MNKHLPYINILLLFGVLVMVNTQCYSQQQLIYKQLDSIGLYMELYQPPKLDANQKFPAMVFFFGGGWVGGSTEQFEPHASYFSKRGIVCILVDYRVRNRHGSSPFDALKDAKSAIRFIRKHAKDYNIDADKIIASGGSAGGHLAAATALISDYNEETDNLDISCVPNALVLFNPVIDNGPGGYGFERIGMAYKNFSPLHNIRKGMPPTVFFLGTKDELIPLETAAYFKKTMERVGSRCELFTYEGEGHGFFNYRNFVLYRKTVKETDYFLQSLGYLSDKSHLEIE